ASLVAALGVGLAWNGVGFRPPYDRIAATLVRDGWNGSQPIAVFGDASRFRMPLEWYLPQAPDLLVARLTRACGEIFVASPSGRATRRLAYVPRGATLLVGAGRDPLCAARGGAVRASAGWDAG